MTRILRPRPFYWPTPVAVAACIATTWFELGISHDDGVDAKANR
jgi:hypothetical protein